MGTSTPKHHAAQYNLVAKKIRDRYEQYVGYHGRDIEPHRHLIRRELEKLALDFARSFKRDNPLFNGPRFLDQCSPDPDAYPLSELWEDEYV